MNEKWKLQTTVYTRKLFLFTSESENPIVCYMYRTPVQKYKIYICTYDTCYLFMCSIVCVEFKELSNWTVVVSTLITLKHMRKKTYVNYIKAVYDCHSNENHISRFFELRDADGQRRPLDATLLWSWPLRFHGSGSLCSIKIVWIIKYFQGYLILSNELKLPNISVDWLFQGFKTFLGWLGHFEKISNYHASLSLSKLLVNTYIMRF